jgi:class 3 adenylate cyclase
VIENACNQAFTYRINGRSTVLEGFGDIHDGSFEEFAKVFEISTVQASNSAIPMNQDFCPYTLTVYPSEELESGFLTYRPALYTSVVALAFLVIFAVAVTYDCVVRRRLKAVMNTALESRAIISSLFPENVRDRLFVEQNEENNDKNGEPRKEVLFGDPGNDQNALHPAKLQLKTFLNETPSNASAANNMDMTILQSKPIADLFPNCTVLFADIAGFTAWSSEREPAQVFTLLQTIFHHFDSIAKKWDVFKVETIGDCYVAVTGLPDPQPDHAVRMAKFAREALRTVSGLTHKMETTLGPDTGDLMMRFGMHSGPVTAGVLRGEKSRFQLFGDTVNLASRMENTGKKGNIQISPTTADLLEEAGKSAWLTPREDLITAKGKGRIQTYWVAAQSNKRANVMLEGDKTDKANQVASEVPTDGDNTNGNDLTVGVATRFLENQSLSQNRKLQRLVDWQTEILARLLRSIVGQRGKKDVAKFINDPSAVLAKRQGDCVLDEVAEVVKLPDFDEKRNRNQISPHTVELSPAVMTQLRDYVLIICSKYKNNPFHNFEHASHVTMSSSKLLSRIVVPENVNYQRDNKKDIASDLHDFTYGITSDPLTQFAAIFCSLIHDVDHQGVSNFQLGAEQPDMNTKYKNRSLAEQNSVDIAWDLLMQPEFRNLQQCIFATKEELQRFRQLVVNLVMATDIFDKPFKDLRNSRWERAFHDKGDLSNEDRFDLRSTIVIEHIIQAADVAHTMQHWHVYTKWNGRLFNEMYLAYENGRNPKDPSEGWYKGELWFFDNYIIPLGKKLDECNVFGVASDEGLNYALANRAEWAIKGEEMVQDMVRRYHENKKATEEEAKS